jgi:hypothetical protein
MKASSQRPKGQEGSIWALNAAIEAVNLAEKTSNFAQSKDVFGSVSTLLTTITVRRSSFSCKNLTRAHIQLGLGSQRTGLC